ncbi:MAG: beta-N-acetylhexosaminidase, partial [Pseudomonadota bacterium]
AKSVLHGLLLADMANCGKHFPGHGFVKADSHVAIPVDKRSLKAIMGDCALPYQWLTTALTSVMPAHVIYPKVDALPAGFSPRWLQDILRGQLHFNGAIFSDDLSMEGARCIEGRSVSFAEAGVAALNAGCDLILLCNQSIGDGHGLDAMLAGLTEHLVKNQWHASDASEQRRRALLPKTAALAWDALMTHPAYVRALDLLP